MRHSVKLCLNEFLEVRLLSYLATGVVLTLFQQKHLDISQIRRRILSIESSYGVGYRTELLELFFG